MARLRSVAAGAALALGVVFVVGGAIALWGNGRGIVGGMVAKREAPATGVVPDGDGPDGSAADGSVPVVAAVGAEVGRAPPSDVRPVPAEAGYLDTAGLPATGAMPDPDRAGPAAAADGIGRGVPAGTEAGIGPAAGSDPLESSGTDAVTTLVPITPAPGQEPPLGGADPAIGPGPRPGDRVAAGTFDTALDIAEPAATDEAGAATGAGDRIPPGAARDTAAYPGLTAPGPADAGPRSESGPAVRSPDAARDATAATSAGASTRSGTENGTGNGARLDAAIDVAAPATAAAPGETPLGPNAAAAAGPIGTGGPDGRSDAEGPSTVASAAPTVTGGASAGGTEAAATPAPPKPEGPVLDLVRIDAKGAAVVAGRSDATGAGPAGTNAAGEVTLRLDGRDVARATADRDGNFVAFFEVPPAPGPRLLTAEVVGIDGLPVMGAEAIIVAPRRPAPPETAGPIGVDAADAAGPARPITVGAGPGPVVPGDGIDMAGVADVPPAVPPAFAMAGIPDVGAEVPTGPGPGPRATADLREEPAPTSPAEPVRPMPGIRVGETAQPVAVAPRPGAPRAGGPSLGALDAAETRTAAASSSAVPEAPRDAPSPASQPRPGAVDLPTRSGGRPVVADPPRGPSAEAAAATVPDAPAPSDLSTPLVGEAASGTARGTAARQAAPQPASTDLASARLPATVSEPPSTPELASAAPASLRPSAVSVGATAPDLPVSPDVAGPKRAAAGSPGARRLFRVGPDGVQLLTQPEEPPEAAEDARGSTRSPTTPWARCSLPAGRRRIAGCRSTSTTARSARSRWTRAAPGCRLCPTWTRGSIRCASTRSTRLGA